jgi:hypothetical protein
MSVTQDVCPKYRGLAGCRYVIQVNAPLSSWQRLDQRFANTFPATTCRGYTHSVWVRPSAFCRAGNTVGLYAKSARANTRLENAVVWEVMACGLVYRYGRFGGTCWLHLRRRNVGIPSSSSPCSWRIRRVFCSLILKMKFVPPSLPRSSYVPSSFWFPCIL